jgi:magnesium-protoporphyrin IX monomethyl ester (oxidative) cyclase
MRVCLINPPLVQSAAHGKASAYPPLEMAYVAAVLEKQHDVTIIDSSAEGQNNIEPIDKNSFKIGLSNKTLSSRIRWWSPDVVAIHVQYGGRVQTGFEVAAIAKDVDKGIITVLDGLYPTTRQLECLSNPNVDYIVRGEPEYTMFELVNCLEKGKDADIKNVKGVSYLKDGAVIDNPPRPEIEDLDSLPFPARHLLPMSIYFEATSDSQLGLVKNSKRQTAMLSSRRCPHECVFCFYHLMTGRKWRARSPKNVVYEVEQLVKTYAIKQVTFSDINMICDRKRMETICDLMIERGLDVDWYIPQGVRADSVDGGLLKKMGAAGCRGICVAPESGVQRIVNQIEKNMDLKSVEKAVVLARKEGIDVGAYFIFGFIGEKKHDMAKTVHFALKLKKLGVKHFLFNIATPIYGTDLYEQAKQGGFLKETLDPVLSQVYPSIETPEFTVGYLRDLCSWANKSMNQSNTWPEKNRLSLDNKIKV